jgi:hypothetical protein
MNTPSVLDDSLLKEAMLLSHAKSEHEVIALALREFVSRRRPKNILDLVGQDLIDPDYDVRAIRAGMNRDSCR